jgi:deazaflavin-dependent oxidoreductase (nitroreductase family)
MPTKTIYHRMKTLNARMAANYQRGFGPRRLVLLLKTIGRKSGQTRVTPLQFEQVDGDYYIASARGEQADWFKNILAHPQVHVQIGKREFAAMAEPVTDPARIADFIELRLRRHPIMIRLIMHFFDGLPWRVTRWTAISHSFNGAIALAAPLAQITISVGKSFLM